MKNNIFNLLDTFDYILNKKGYLEVTLDLNDAPILDIIHRYEKDYQISGGYAGEGKQRLIIRKRYGNINV